MKEGHGCLSYCYVTPSLSRSLSTDTSTSLACLPSPHHPHHQRLRPPSNSGQTNSQQPSVSSFREQIGRQKFITSGTGTGTVKLRGIVEGQSVQVPIPATVLQRGGVFRKVALPRRGGDSSCGVSMRVLLFACCCPGSWVRDN